MIIIFQMMKKVKLMRDLIFEENFIHLKLYFKIFFIFTPFAFKILILLMTFLFDGFIDKNRI